MANITPTLTLGDFDENKADLKRFLNEQGVFTDHNFEGSILSAIVDVLAYNSYQRLLFDSFSVSETFRDSAQLRKNVAARAEEYGYTPRSYRSAVASIRVTLRSAVARSSVVIPRGTLFTARVGDRLFSFTTETNVVAEYAGMDNSNHVFIADLTIREGVITTETFVITDQPLIINNRQVDIDSIVVTVTDNGTTTTYDNAKTVVGIDSSSLVYFVRYDSVGKYSLSFGNGVVGNRPSPGSKVVVEYRIAAGSAVNSARTFIAGQSIDGITDIDIITVSAASGGAEEETVESIRENSRYSQVSQGRGVSEPDFAALCRSFDSSIVDVIATGGQNLDPPQYGKIAISVISSDGETLVPSRKQALHKFLQQRTVIEPIITDAERLYVEIDASVTLTPGGVAQAPDNVITLVKGVIENYALTNAGKFNARISVGKIIAAISSLAGIDTNTVVLRPYKVLKTNGTSLTTSFCTSVKDVMSSEFTLGSRQVFIRNEDNILEMVDKATNQVIDSGLGTVDLATGKFTVSLPVSATNTINMYATMTGTIIAPTNNAVPTIRSQDIEVTLV